MMIRLGLIGCGGMGDVHRQAIQQLGERATFTAAVDLELARAEETAALRGTHIGSNFGTPWMEGEGTSNVTLKFANGALGYHFGTWGARGTRLQYSFHAHCTKGMLEAQVTQGRLILHQGAEEDATGAETVLFTTDPGKHVHNELIHFVECLESGQRPLTDGIRSLQSLRVIWQLYEAEAQGVVADLRGLGISYPSGH